MTYNGTPATVIRARDLTAGDLIDGALALSRLAAEGFDAHPHDWRDAERRLWSVERVTLFPDDLAVVITTGRHGIWSVPEDLPVTRRGSLIRKD